MFLCCLHKLESSRRCLVFGLLVVDSDARLDSPKCQRGKKQSKKSVFGKMDPTCLTSNRLNTRYDNVRNNLHSLSNSSNGIFLVSRSFTFSLTCKWLVSECLLLLSPQCTLYQLPSRMKDEFFSSKAVSRLRYFSSQEEAPACLLAPAKLSGGFVFEHSFSDEKAFISCIAWKRLKQGANRGLDPWKRAKPEQSPNCLYLPVLFLLQSQQSHHSSI